MSRSRATASTYRRVFKRWNRLTHTHTHTRTHMHTHAHTCTHTHIHSLFLSLTFTRTYTHILSLSQTLTHTSSHTFSVSSTRKLIQVCLRFHWSNVGKIDGITSNFGNYYGTVNLKLYETFIISSL